MFLNLHCAPLSVCVCFFSVSPCLSLCLAAYFCVFSSVYSVASVCLSLCMCHFSVSFSPFVNVCLFFCLHCLLPISSVTYWWFSRLASLLRPWSHYFEVNWNQRSIQMSECPSKSSSRCYSFLVLLLFSTSCARVSLLALVERPRNKVRYDWHARS